MVILMFVMSGFLGFILLSTDPTEGGRNVVKVPLEYYEVDVRPMSVFMADVDGDANMDIISSNIRYQYKHGVSIRPAIGTITVIYRDNEGGQRGRVDCFVGQTPRSVYVGDLDNQNGPDIVTANIWDNTTTVLLNDGSGGFPQDGTPADDGDGRTDFAVGNFPKNVHLSDVDDDGFLDIVTANVEFDPDPAGESAEPTNSSISVLLNDGSGGFPVSGTPEHDGDDRTDYALGPEVKSMDMGDMNGDELDDIVAGCSYGVDVLINDGTGYFTQGSSDHIGTADKISLGDIDLDGDLDLVQAKFEDDSVSVLRNDGNGRLEDTSISYSVGQDPVGISLRDMDEDGTADMVVANRGYSTVSIRMNNGIGTFGKQIEYRVGEKPSEGEWWGGISSLFVGDINADEHLDIIVCNDIENTVSVLKNNGIGAFSTRADYSFWGDQGGMGAATLGDVDGDNKPDIITVNRNNSIMVLLNNGGGVFGHKRFYSASSGGTEDMGVALGDIDEDGHGDVVTTNRIGDNQDYVSVLRNDGSGGFSDRTDCKVGEWPISICLGDVSGDDFADIVTGNYGERQYEGKVTVLLNDGTGNFSQDATGGKDADDRTDYQLFKSIYSVYLGDVNGDGDLDIVTANEEESGLDSVSVLINNGSGGFEDRFDYPVGDSPRSVVLGDIDIDGDLDIVTANSADNTIAILKNNGSGGFGPKIGYAVGDGPLTLAIDDIDGDYDLDIVTGNHGDNTVSVLRNEGGSLFGSRIDYTVGKGPQTINLGYVNGDDDPDIVTLNTIDSSITVLINSGNGDFMLDSDGDGYPDLIDAFPEDKLEWMDSDDDGFGDNVDHIPWDPLEHMDLDGDYHGDKFDDLFPTDDAQWADKDGDGFGDNLPWTTVKVRDRIFHVTSGDLFPDDPREWADLDNDTVGDNGDALPGDITQCMDSDGDGFGDNAPGSIITIRGVEYVASFETGDRFPDDPREWSDLDNDTVGDNRDAFPNDMTQWEDTDGDGYGDNHPGKIITLDGMNFTASNETGDWFSNDNNEWSDFDLDGMGNNGDSDDDNDDFLDEWEIYLGTEPKDNSSRPRDSDNDSLPNGDTINSQSWMDFDDDNDGYSDMMEANYGSDPLVHTSIPADWDEDKFPDNIDADDDNDEYPDVIDAFPLDAAASIDSDDDGLPDKFHSWYKTKEDIWNILPEKLQTTTLNEDDDDDDDGYQDSNDAFPLDPFEWKDTDGDGVGDNDDEDADGDGLEKDDSFLFFFDYSDTDDSDPDKGWLISETIPLSTVTSFFKILGGVLLIWMVGIILRKKRFIKFDKQLDEVKSIKELDRWYHHQIELAMEHGLLDYIGSRHLKAGYEKQRRRLMEGRTVDDGISFGERLRKSFVFSPNDFSELPDRDKKDDAKKENDRQIEERTQDKEIPEGREPTQSDNGIEISEPEEETEVLDESFDYSELPESGPSSELDEFPSGDSPAGDLSTPDLEVPFPKENEPQDGIDTNLNPLPIPPPVEKI